jgi:hypothetical protein
VLNPLHLTEEVPELDCRLDAFDALGRVVRNEGVDDQEDALAIDAVLDNGDGITESSLRQDQPQAGRHAHRHEQCPRHGCDSSGSRRYSIHVIHQGHFMPGLLNSRAVKLARGGGRVACCVASGQGVRLTTDN